MNEYFYIDQTTNQQWGPFLVNDLKTKNLTPDTMVWCSGMANWTIAGNVPELSVLFGYNQSNPISPNYGTTIVQPPLPKTWFVESILVTFFGSIIFGILAILKSSKVESLYYAGDYEGSEQASKDAKKFIIIGIIFKAVILLFVIIFIMSFIIIDIIIYLVIIGTELHQFN